MYRVSLKRGGRGEGVLGPLTSPTKHTPLTTHGPTTLSELADSASLLACNPRLCVMYVSYVCLALGQVAHRMNYWLRFKEVTGISLGLWCLSYILYSALPRNTNPGGISNLMYALFFLILLCQLRGVVRARYAIPVSQPYIADCYHCPLYHSHLRRYIVCGNRGA